MSIIKFDNDVPVKVTLDYDGPKTVEGNYGTQYLYGVNNGADTFYATSTLTSLIEATGAVKGSEITILKIPKTDERTGKEISIFTVDGKSTDDYNRGGVANSPVGTGFAHKDTKAERDAGLTMSDLDYRISLLEDAVTGLEENQHHHPRMDADSEKDGRKAEAELPF